MEWDYRGPEAKQGIKVDTGQPWTADKRNWVWFLERMNKSKKKTPTSRSESTYFHGL